MCFQRVRALPIALVVAVMAGAWGAGCGGEVRVGADANLTCESDSDCPRPMTCTVAANRCVLPGVVLDTVAPLFLSSSSSTSRLGAEQDVTVTLVFSEAIATASVSVDQGRTGPGTPLAGVVVEGDTVVVDLDGSTLVSGPLALVAAVTDTAGLLLQVRIATGVVVDVDAPDIVADDVAVFAAVKNPLFPGRTASARIDSTVTVTVTWDEPLAVDAVAEVTLRDSAGAVSTPAVAPLSADTRSTFDIDAADVAGFADGDIEIALAVVDDVGNRAVRVVPTPIVKDTTPPPAPTFARLRRSPFGAEHADVKTDVEGAATDAVLVLVVPAGVLVGPLDVPLHVGRIAPDAQGRLALTVEIDVPAVRLVSVDAAGNQSEAARADITELVASTAAVGTPHRLLARPVATEVLVQGGDVVVDDALRAAGAAGITTEAAPFWRPVTSIEADVANGRALLAPDPVLGGVIMVADGETFRVRGSTVERLDVPRLPMVRGAAMATDTRRGRIVLFGGAQAGVDAAGIVRNDLFEWDGTRWSQVLQHNPAATDRPSPRVGHGAGFVAAEGGVVIVNGCGADFVNFLGCAAPLAPEVWVWDGVSFSRRCAGAACGDAPQPIRPEVMSDTDGVLLVTGGANDSGFTLVESDPPPALKRFVGGTFTGRCAGACARAIPVDGLAYRDARTGVPTVLGSCGSVACLVAVNADDTTTTTELDNDVGVPAADAGLQQRPFTLDGDRLLLAERTFPGQRILAVDRGEFGQVFPRVLSPRCGGSVVVIGGEAQVVGGCGACRLGPAADQCLTPTTVVEAPLSARSSRPGGVVSGTTSAVPVDGGDTALVSWQLLDGVGTMEVRRASAMDQIQRFDLGRDTYVAAAVSPGGSSRVVVVTAISDVVTFPPDFRILEPVLIVDTSVAGASLQPGCERGCALNRSTGLGVVAAATRDGRALLFGGDVRNDVVDATIIIDELGQGTVLDLAVHPSARQGAAAAFDVERELTWVFGGTVRGENVTSSPPVCADAGGPSACSDVWTFDGAAWTEVHPVDILGVGTPAARFRAQLGVVAGRVVVAGGAIGDGSLTLSDAWVLEASTTTPPSHQLVASFAPYGTDAEQTFAGLSMRWCGSAHDATGAEVPVALRAFAGGGWREFDTVIDVDDATCVVGVLDVGDIADVVVRDPGRAIVVEVVPQLTHTGRQAPSITTTAYTATAQFVARR
jgi:hypothetical protein